jgi:methionyl-tRNA formyltransferase
MTKPSIVIVTDNPASWSIAGTQRLIEQLQAEGCAATFAHAIKEAPSADIAIYLSCERIVPAAERARFRHNLVVHASDLPRGRGWSPMTWRILEGADRLTVTLFEAIDELDAGDIYAQAELVFEGHELIDELRAKLDAAIHDLIIGFTRQWPNVTARPQQGESSFYPRRRPQDSKLDPDKSLRENFNALRVVDNDRYPAYFEHAGHVYELRITKRGPVR